MPTWSELYPSSVTYYVEYDNISLSCTNLGLYLLFVSTPPETVEGKETLTKETAETLGRKLDLILKVLSRPLAINLVTPHTQD
jgi:hypothetical protein